MAHLKAGVNILMDVKPVGLRCKYCRHTLVAKPKDFVYHEVPDRPNSTFAYKDSKMVQAIKCSLYFVEQQDWILNGLEDIESSKEGPVNCPKCKHKVGGWSWVGIQCSCGTWVSPAFSFIKSKVDPIINVVPASCIRHNVS